MLLGAAIASPALAQDAEALRAQGRAALHDGRFDDALRLFRSATESSVDPSVWLEVGDAADRLRDDGTALDAYERYLVARPDAPDRAEIRARIAVLRTVLERGAMPTRAANIPDFIPAETILDALRSAPPEPVGLGRRLGRP